MLRQNRSEGSSTSRSFAKTALLRARRKTFQFSDEQFARHIFFTEPLFLIPSVQTEVQESGSTRGAILFSKEPLFLMPPGRARSPRGSQGSRVRKGTAALFSREPLFLVPSPLRSVAQKRQQIGSPGIIARFLREPLFLLPSGRDWRSRKHGHWADRDRRIVFRGNHFPSFRWVHGRPVGRNLSPAVLSLALHCKEVAEFRQYRKRARRCSDFFRQHPDTVLAKVPKEMAPLGEMPNPERIKAH